MVLRCGHFSMMFTIILMILASLNRTSTVRARETETFKYPPCTFNPLCTCSKPAPDLGIVQCRHVPFPAIPRTINNSKVFMLHMENTGLRELEAYFLQATGNTNDNDNHTVTHTKRFLLQDYIDWKYLII